MYYCKSKEIANMFGLCCVAGQDAPGLESAMNPRPDYGLNSYKGLGRLKDLKCVVTGGDSGIGRAVCLAFAREGADVVCAYLNEHEDAAETARAVKDSGRDCFLVSSDISSDQGCKKVIDEAVKKFGHIDVLVNNAAFQGKSVEKLEDLDWDRVEYTFRTNIISMFALTRFALPHMKAGTSIINTGSIQAYDPSAPILDYAATKAAIVGFTKGLAQDLTEKRGIRVNCVAPGPVMTPLVVSSFPAEKLSKFGEKYPMNRPAQPVELAPAYVFLASQEAKYISGEVLGVTGGKQLA
jgi:NAD(P)-dependent dehydrogenase (short-subunit alcohol dehydrogenase family)